MTSLCAAVDVLVRRVYDSLGIVIAAAFFLYAVIAFTFVGVVFDAVAPSLHGRRRCRQPVWTPDDGQPLAERPSAITATSPRCSATGTVTRAFSETKV